MKATVNEILKSVRVGPIRTVEAIADSRAIRVALSQALADFGQPDIAGQVFAVFVNPRLKRVSVRWTPLEANTDVEAVARFQTWVPIGYVVTVDTTRDGDEEITAFSTRGSIFADADTEKILKDAHERINAIVRDELSEVYREETADIA